MGCLYFCPLLLIPGTMAESGTALGIFNNVENKNPDPTDMNTIREVQK